MNRNLLVHYKEKNYYFNKNNNNYAKQVLNQKKKNSEINLYKSEQKKRIQKDIEKNQKKTSVRLNNIPSYCFQTSCTKFLLS